ncbi:unnamed protein product [Eruca vesicaria subsp. sativa]|uniref:E3 ubiquitin-protein ligase RMA n=1 Tax=Eruca vesicaria subsp. sativa TaxID=29727 RepID=A0ABC8KAI4_ERUVS|nr:unnamed protein product [Eruca vesicaria subsp. sativa]
MVKRARDYSLPDRTTHKTARSNSSRIRQRETTARALALVPSNEHRNSTAGVIHERSRERLVKNGENKTYLIAKALNTERTSSTVPGGYFDCNICLVKAQDPVLTCCGHLFCWGCFHQLPLVYLNIKECPVCDGEVTDAEVIPIYGNGDDNSKTKLEGCGVLLPPRPHAKRVESFRQKIINRGVPFVPETMEHIRRAIDSIVTSGGGEQQHLHPPLRLLPSFASFPSLVVHTSEIPPFDDVDSFIDTTSLRRNRRRSSRIAEISSSLQRNRSNNASSETAGSSSVRDFVVPGSSTATRSQTLNPTQVATSASSSTRRTEDVNSGPQTRSRRRLR